MVDVSVIIPNWNGADLLFDCLVSLKKQTYKNFEIIVVDNGSTDTSVNFIKENYPKIKIVILDRNYGFAKAINSGVKLSKAKYVAFLNNDTEVDKSWLNNLVKTIDKHPEAASVGSKLLNFYNRKIIDGVGIQINEVGQAKSIGWNEKDKGQYEKEMLVFGVTGGASLFRRSIFIKVGMFDENYFMYCEEVDWAFRAQFSGYKAIYCPNAIVYHKHKMSSKKTPQHLEYWQFRNMTQTIIKDFPMNILLKQGRWLKIVLVHLNTYIYMFKNGFYWPSLLADFWIILHLPILLKMRFSIQSSKKIKDDEIEKFLFSKNITYWGLLKKK
ncbi:MAG: glycosyltransferase family 2 protein [Candidatus Daviesbacteria bacterium]|nr:glycosyltransferase family 2 protein [Candidatus Daviesbacteria bacterium]